MRTSTTFCLARGSPFLSAGCGPSPTAWSAPVTSVSARRDTPPPILPSDLNAHEYNFLFGPRVSFSVGRVRPFAHGLVGAGHVSVSTTGYSASDTSFATALGGGLDFKLIPVVSWRFQGDFLQTRFFGNTQNNGRFSTGIVLNF